MRENVDEHVLELLLLFLLLVVDVRLKDAMQRAGLQQINKRQTALFEFAEVDRQVGKIRRITLQKN